jgi:hypothetical protein
MIDITQVIPNIRNRYHATKSDAKRRGIDWQFTFDSWLDWWGSDIVNRGPGPGQLVMARTGDIGPYHPSNVRKATTAENQNEAHLGKKKVSSWNKGKKHSNETREKMSASIKEVWAKRKLDKELS